MDDLIQDQLMGWLEENSTLTEKAPADNDSDAAGDEKPAATKKSTAKKKAAKSEADSEG